MLKEYYKAQIRKERFLMKMNSALVAFNIFFTFIAYLNNKEWAIILLLLFGGLHLYLAYLAHKRINYWESQHDKSAP